MQQTRDSKVEQSVLREVQLRAEISSKELCAFCCGGVLTLSGTVKNHNEKRAAHQAAGRTPGVLRVINNIRLSSDLLRRPALRMIGGSLSTNTQESVTEPLQSG